MTGAVMPKPSPGQLTENITDVLASIRRMIAQDSPARVEGPGVLRLEAATRTPPLRLSALGATSPLAREGGAEAGVEGSADGDALPVSGDAAAEAAASAAAEDNHLAAEVPQLDAADAPAAAEEPEDLTAALDSRAEVLSPDSPNAATSAALIAPQPTPEAPEPTMTLHAPVQPAPHADEDEGAASILGTLIRDVIRQELHGDPSGRMSRDLRSMILREVARAIVEPAEARTL